jgi:DNA-binding MarR family transcriptional regulator
VDTVAADMELAERVWLAMRTFVEAHAKPDKLREQLGLGLGVGRVKALLLLDSGPLTLGEIAAAHRVDAPHATVIVDNLEALGLVTRTSHPDDRRRRLVTLTDKGHDAVSLARRTLAEPPSPLRELPEAALRQLDDALRQIAEQASTAVITTPS